MSACYLLWSTLSNPSTEKLNSMTVGGRPLNLTITLRWSSNELGLPITLVVHVEHESARCVRVCVFAFPNSDLWTNDLWPIYLACLFVSTCRTDSKVVDQSFYGHKRIKNVAVVVGATSSECFCSFFKAVRQVLGSQALDRREKSCRELKLVPPAVEYNSTILFGLRTGGGALPGGYRAYKCVYIGWQWRNFFISAVSRHFVGQALRSVCCSDICCSVDVIFSIM